jgi:hypothetical protein
LVGLLVVWRVGTLPEVELPTPTVAQCQKPPASGGDKEKDKEWDGKVVLYNNQQYDSKKNDVVTCG